MTTSNQTRPTESALVSQRLMSVDALRGFDMFWIIGADSLVYALNRMSHTRSTTFLADELEHAEWQGFHFYDLIFPLFVFIAGVSLVFSLTKTIQHVGRAEALKRVFRRSILLFLIGIFYSGGLTSPWPDIRLMGVLNRIALAYFFAGLLFCCFKPRALVAICVAILAGYWAIMTFTPVRNIQLTKSNLAHLAEQAGDMKTAALFNEEANPSAVKDSPAWAAAEKMFYATTIRVTGKFDPGLNLVNHIDFEYLGGRKYDTFFDPEGLLSTFPAVVTCLLGVFAGLLLRNQAVPDQRKVVYLIAFGIAAVALGWLWNAQFPVIKKIWTSSYVLVAGGYSAILLGVFYLIVDVWQTRAWCQPFVWMGMNSITIYLASNILGGFRKLASRFAGGDVRIFLDGHVAKGFGEMVISIVGLLLAFWLVHFLYKRKIFLRL
ncbi:MAG: acyltransferase family protein [Limisphaerales bacterium]